MASSFFFCAERRPRLINLVTPCACTRGNNQKLTGWLFIISIASQSPPISTHQNTLYQWTYTNSYIASLHPTRISQATPWIHRIARLAVLYILLGAGLYHLRPLTCMATLPHNVYLVHGLDSFVAEQADLSTCIQVMHCFLPTWHAVGLEQRPLSVPKN